VTADNFDRFVYVQGKDARANDESQVADEIGHFKFQSSPGTYLPQGTFKALGFLTCFVNNKYYK
jgi:hypothetical protein